MTKTREDGPPYCIVRSQGLYGLAYRDLSAFGASLDQAAWEMLDVMALAHETLLERIDELEAKLRRRG